MSTNSLRIHTLMGRNRVPERKCSGSLEQWSDGRPRPSLRLSQPDPAIFRPVPHQSSADGIIQHVLQFLSGSFLPSQRIIERFFLPNAPLTIQELINFVRGGTLYRLHDSRNTDGSRVIYDGRQQHMNMVGHNNQAVEMKEIFIPTEESFNHNIPSLFRKN